MAFDGFQLSQIELDDVSLRVRHGGAGPAVLLLHGFPETHMMWAQVAEGLAQAHTVICPDLRGYGGSSLPHTAPDHSQSSKRAMARDAVALMKEFGFETFCVAGHDRGGRVAYRLALDHPHAVKKVSLLDIIPTGEVWARADRRFALGYWHWSFFAQPHPLPERLIGADPEWFHFKALFAGASTICHGEALADYAEAVSRPSVVHAMCEDYRAGAGYDRRLDEMDKSAGRKIACPAQLLWGAKSPVGAWYDVLEVWREWAPDLSGQALDCGHFIPEEKPAETLKLLGDFFA